MSKNLQDIDDLFKKSIDDYEEMPSKNVWENIEKSLNEKNLFSLKIKYATLKKYAVLLLLLLLGSTCYYYTFSKKAGYRIFNGNDKIGIKNAGKKITDNAAAIKIKLTDKKSYKDVVSLKKEPGINVTPNTSFPIKANVADIGTDHNLIKIKSGKNNPDKSTNSLKGIAFDNKEKNVLHAKYQRQNKPIKTSVNDYNKEEAISWESYTEHDVKTKNNTNSTTRFVDNYVPEKLIANLELLKLKAIVSSRLLNLAMGSIAGLSNLAANNSRMKKQKLTNRFTVIMYASPETAFDRLEDDQLHNYMAPAAINRPPDNRSKIKDEEHRTGSFSAGILIDYALKNNFSIQSGISIVNKSSETDPKKVFAEMDNDGTIKYKYNCAFGSSFINPKIGTAIVIGDSATATATSNKLMYVGIPVNLSYHLKKGRFQISPIIGTTINFLVKQGISTGITDAAGSQKQHSTNINGVKSMYINTNVGIDFSYSLNHKVALTVMPSTALALSAVNKNSTVKSFPNTFGIRAGLKINL